MSKVKRAPLPRRPWYGPDKLRAAYLAGQGVSAPEIARMMGGTTARRVREMLRVHGLSVMRENSGEDILFVRWKAGDRELLNQLADKMDREPGELAALIIRRAMERPGLVSELVHELDVV